MPGVNHERGMSGKNNLVIGLQLLLDITQQVGLSTSVKEQAGLVQQ